MLKEFYVVFPVPSKPLTTPTVGFNVGLSKNQVNPPATIEFDSVINHYGNCWNNSTHMFVAPVTGFYWFQMTIMNLETAETWAALMHGNKVLQRTYCAPHGTYHSSTGTAVAKVNKGETVLVRLMSGKVHSHGYHWTNFVGFLIHQI